jgi:hypothetical protein
MKTAAMIRTETNSQNVGRVMQYEPLPNRQLFE